MNEIMDQNSAQRLMLFNKIEKEKNNTKNRILFIHTSGNLINIQAMFDENKIKKHPDTHTSGKTVTLCSPNAHSRDYELWRGSRIAGGTLSHFCNGRSTRRLRSSESNRHDQ